MPAQQCLYQRIGFEIKRLTHDNRKRNIFTVYTLQLLYYITLQLLHYSYVQLPGRSPDQEG
jgi:hypothetical protein